MTAQTVFSFMFGIHTDEVCEDSSDCPQCGDSFLKDAYIAIEGENFRGRVVPSWGSPRDGQKVCYECWNDLSRDFGPHRKIVLFERVIYDDWETI